MSRTLILSLLVVTTAGQASAQLTPQQRAARTQAPSAANSTRLSQAWEQRSLNGDPTAYFGQTGRMERRTTGERLRLMGATAYLPALIYSPAELPSSDRPMGSHWMAIGMREATPMTLRRAESARFDARADIPLRLTLASPAGAPGRSLMIRAAVQQDAAAPVWSTMTDVTADAEGRYLVDVPTLVAGDYRLEVTVYDPAHPEAPYSSSKTPLIVRQP